MTEQNNTKVTRKRKVKKTTVLGTATALIPWGFRQLMSGDPHTGFTALSFGSVLLYLYVEYDAEDIPMSTEDFKELSSTAGDGLENTIDGITEEKK